MPTSHDRFESRILEIRGERVMLDRDLATLYGVSTTRLNEQVSRNRARFPVDFIYQLTRDELRGLISQNAISNKGRGGVRKLPWVFTEHGAIMAAMVVNSARAVDMSVFVVRAFVHIREQSIARGELASRLQAIERKLLRHDTSLQQIYREIRALHQAPASRPLRRIGFRPDDG